MTGKQSSLALDDADIRFARENEGYLYGEGTSELLLEIKKALLDLDHPDPLPPKLCAETIHSVLRKFSEKQGQNPDIETFMREFGEEGKKTYHVSWESGPYDWSIHGSFVVMNVTNRLCEPNYGFDLQLYDVE